MDAHLPELLKNLGSADFISKLVLLQQTIYSVANDFLRL